MNLTTVGIDIAKNVFQLYGVDEKGQRVLTKRLKRPELATYLANLPACLIGMEACGGSHHWARTFQQMGHTVKLMSPQYVKPYVKTNKNDYNDAEAICEAVTRPTMRFVAIKTIGQQDVLLLHKIRSRLIGQRTQLQNQIRGLLMEYGIIIPRGLATLRSKLAEILPEGTELSEAARGLFRELNEELSQLTQRIDVHEKKLRSLVKTNAACERLETIPGIGPVSASALVATIGDAAIFKTGRQLAAFFGLVPRQHSSGDKQRLLGISKRGNTYIRSLLVHGARAVVAAAMKKQDKHSVWIQQLAQRRGFNRAVVALANKNARRVWALLTHNTVYKIATL